MRVLFVSRKKINGYGGLSRFAKDLSANFSGSYLLSPSSLILLFKLPFLKIDLIHLCDLTLLPIGFILALILNKPLTLTTQGLDIIWPNPLYQFLIRTLLPYSKAIICSSKASQKLLHSQFRYSKSKTTPILPGISISQFSNPQPFTLPIQIKNKLVLTSVSNLVLRKGHAWFLINIFIKLPKNYIYFIVGSGPEKNNIQKTISHLKLDHRVFLLGNLPNENLSYLLSKTDIFICTNQKVKANFEGLGLAWGEAAMFGIPVIATTMDGIPEIIKDKQNGLLVNPNPKDYLNALKSLKTLKSRRLLAKKAKTFTSKNFSWEKSAALYSRLFQKVLNNTL